MNRSFPQTLLRYLTVTYLGDHRHSEEYFLTSAPCVEIGISVTEVHIYILEKAARQNCCCPVSEEGRRSQTGNAVTRRFHRNSFHRQTGKTAPEVQKHNKPVGKPLSQQTSQLQFNKDNNKNHKTLGMWSYL